MWIGLLTAGTHPSRPANAERLATLFVWGPQARARIDGPQDQITAGIRTLRLTAGDDVGTLCLPRCFACRHPYPLPDPFEVRAQQETLDLEGGFGDTTEPDPAEGGDDLTGPRQHPSGRAVFALVHVEDRAPAGAEGEALVLVPSIALAVLVPFDALGILAELLGEAFAEQPLPECERCGEVAPGGNLGEPNRAARRRAARDRQGRGGRRAA